MVLINLCAPQKSKTTVRAIARQETCQRELLHLARDENTASTVVTEIQHSTGVNINISISKGIRIRAQHPNKIGQRGAVKYGAW